MAIPEDVTLFLPLDPAFSNEARIDLLQLFAYVSRRLGLPQLLPEDIQSTPVPVIC